MLFDAWHYIATHPTQFATALGVDVTLSASAFPFAAPTAIPLEFVVARRAGLALAAINAANVGRTLPSLAVLALAMPIVGTGFVPSLAALTLLALPPILTNTIAGIIGVERDIIDAARGMGMSARDILRRIEIPLATPIVFAGLRTSAVQVVSGAVLAAFIGGGGLGDFITAGIAMMAVPQLLVGAIPVTLLSLGTDFLFGSIQRRLTPAALR